MWFRELHVCMQVCMDATPKGHLWTSGTMEQGHKTWFLELGQIWGSDSCLEPATLSWTCLRMCVWGYGDACPILQIKKLWLIATWSATTAIREGSLEVGSVPWSYCAMQQLQAKSWHFEDIWGRTRTMILSDPLGDRGSRRMSSEGHTSRLNKVPQR